jgi:protein-ribulosamine 3-kinase
MSLWQHIEAEISRVTARPFRLQNNQGVTGGCINQASRIGDGERNFFIKLNRAALLPMFEAEALALTELATRKTVRVPGPVCSGKYESQSYVVLEYLPLQGRADMRLLGEQLAAMHQYTVPLFGWHIDNTIGSTPQANAQSRDWLEFWRENRLGFQLSLAARNGFGGGLQRKGERLLADFPALFSNYTPQASMLHGDLWGGNVAGLKDNSPVIFDPAFYYGDRETDIAMTTLFGGFGTDFYAAYNAAWPLDEGYKVRRTFYNIYHILNHLNLFGSGYQGQAISMIEQVLAELG